jgi:hypothetical protein
VRRHAENNNLVFIALLLEFERVMALMTVNDRQQVATNSPPFCMLIKVLYPLKAKLVLQPFLEIAITQS